MELTVNLSDKVLEVLGFDRNAAPEAVKDRLEKLDKIPILHMKTEAGDVRIGFNDNDMEADYPQAFTMLVPKGSTTEIDMCLADIPKKENGNVNLLIYADPFSQDSTYNTVLKRDEVIEAMKSIDDYKEPAKNHKHPSESKSR